MNLINLERQKTGKNINNKETNVSPFYKELKTNNFNNLNPKVIPDNHFGQL